MLMVLHLNFLSSRNSLFDTLNPESKKREIIPSIIKILLGIPEDKKFRCKTISIDYDNITAYMIFNRSLSPTYLQVILYILNIAKAVSLIIMKVSRAV